MTGRWPWGAHIDGCTVDLCNGRFKSDKQDRVKVNGAVIETRSDRPMLSLGWTVSHCNLPAPLTEPRKALRHVVGCLRDPSVVSPQALTHSHHSSSDQWFFHILSDVNKKKIISETNHCLWGDSPPMSAP